MLSRRWLLGLATIATFLTLMPTEVSAAPNPLERFFQSGRRIQLRRWGVAGQFAGSGTSSITVSKPLEILDQMPAFISNAVVHRPAEPVIANLPKPLPSPPPMQSSSPGGLTIVPLPPDLYPTVNRPTPATPPRPTVTPPQPIAPTLPITPTVSIPQRPAPPVNPPPTTVDALLNFDEGPYPAAERLISGDPGPWHESEVVHSILGRVPSAEERSSFQEDVLEMVEENFESGGLEISLSDSSTSAAHTISIVSGAVASSSENAIGIADIGGDGFTLIDAFDPSAIGDFDALKTAVANNVSHELMHAFGVADHFHDTGGDLDAGLLDWEYLVDDNTSFSDEAIAELASVDFQDRWDDGVLFGLQASAHDHDPDCACGHCESFTMQVTPEPTTIALWGSAILGCCWAARRRQKHEQ